MSSVKEFVLINQLLDIYYQQLSNSQQEILSLYYRYNLSISEIANQKEISRSAVNDALKKGVNALYKLEDQLHILRKDNAVNNLIKELSKDNKNEKLIKEFNKEYK